MPLIAVLQRLVTRNSEVTGTSMSNAIAGSSDHPLQRARALSDLILRNHERRGKKDVISTLPSNGPPIGLQINPSSNVADQIFA